MKKFLFFIIISVFLFSINNLQAASEEESVSTNQSITETGKGVDGNEGSGYGNIEGERTQTTEKQTGTSSNQGQGQGKGLDGNEGRGKGNVSNDLGIPTAPESPVIILFVMGVLIVTGFFIIQKLKNSK